MLTDSQMFFRHWLRDPLAIGAFKPSSRDLAAAIARLVPIPPGGPVIELGGGTGPVTRALLAAGVPADQLYVVERETELYSYLTERFPDVTVVQGDATELTRLMRPLGIEQAAVVVSGLPLLSMKRSAQRAIVEESFALLAPGAPYIQFTYGWLSPVPRRELGLVGRPEASVFGNLPPARVWVYRRPVAAESNGQNGRTPRGV